MELNEYLNKLIANKGVTAYEVSLKSGVAQSTLSRLLQGETKKMSIKTKTMLANYFNVNESVFDQSEFNESVHLVKSETENSDFDASGYYYPDVSASAGLELEMVNTESLRIPVKIPNQKNVDYINVYGDSMYPKFCSGDIIGIKEVEHKYVNPGYPYVVIFNDGQVFLKYIRKGKDENHWLLTSENPKYEPFECSIDMIKKVFIIKGAIIKTTM